MSYKVAVYTPPEPMFNKVDYENEQLPIEYVEPTGFNEDSPIFNLDNKADVLQGFIETLIRNGAKDIIQQ